MKRTRDYIDLVREKTTTGTDYAVAKLLGMSHDAVSQYRAGTRVMDNNACRKLSEVLGLPLEELITVAEIERARDDDTRKAWEVRLKRFGRRAASALLVISAACGFPLGGTKAEAMTLASEQVQTSAPAYGTATTPSSEAHALYYVKSWRAALRTARRCIDTLRRITPPLALTAP